MGYGRRPGLLDAAAERRCQIRALPRIDRCYLGTNDSDVSHRRTNPHPTRVRVSRMTGINNKLPQTKDYLTVEKVIHVATS